MKFLSRLALALVAGIVCGSSVLLLNIGLIQLYNLNPSHNGLFFDLQFILDASAFMFASFLPTSILQKTYDYDYFLAPFALWFIVGLGARLVSRSGRATLFICVGLFFLNLLPGFVLALLMRGIGP
jgi:hypothetical protein